MSIHSLLVIATCVFFASALNGEEVDATVTTDSGTYQVPVEVEDGEVTHVIWPNGGHMTVNGGDIDNGEADGTNSGGDSVHIELDDATQGEENSENGDE